MKNLHSVTFLLLAIGGLNWLLVGVLPSQWEVGHLLGGMDSWLSRLVYILVGLSAIIEIAQHKANCKNCDKPANKMA